ncbi:MAG: hypothetical protein IT198_00670 [Acidimicrobiia bacterium]|nr:hypothetical protein [Acidimicrobiia bacterium]
MKTVAVLGAMPAELRPLLRHVDRRVSPAGRLRSLASGAATELTLGACPGTTLLAAVTGVGTAAAGVAAARILATREVDRLFLIGIAGGVGPRMHVGDLVVPEVVEDGASGALFRPRPLPGIEPRGRLLTTDTLVVDHGELSHLAAGGTIALDMETAAVAAACEDVGCPWSVIRAVSDRAGASGVDSGVLDLVRTDGSTDLSAVLRHVTASPWRIPRLIRLARGMHVATRVAVRTFLDALTRLCTAPVGEEP